MHNIEMSGQTQVNDLNFSVFLRMTVKQQMKNTMTSWEREASEKGKAFYDSTFNHPSLWTLNKRLSVLIFHWTECCWSLEGGWYSLVGLTVFLLSLPVCLGLGASRHFPGATHQTRRPPRCSRASLPKYQGGELPSLVWPGMLGCLYCSWLCDFSLL